MRGWIYPLCSIFADKQKVSVGDEAPDFILRDINGETHQLSDYKGKGVFEFLGNMVQAL